MAGGRTCFVIMPIRSEGSEDYLHFRTIYDDWIRPVLVEAGYSVVRGDDVQAAGAITKDVILRLAHADLVVADLTDLNPNVFYELGVRHALRGSGTVMLLDEGRTEAVPFDLTAYRVIMFRSDLLGIGKLRRDLANFAKALAEDAGTPRRDNPVHDWIPTLPINASAASTGSEAEELRIQIAGLERKLRNYEQAYGLVERESTSTQSASGVILTALQQASQGTLASDLVADAHSATVKQDRTAFLSVVNRIVQSSVRLSAREFLTLTRDASSLGLGDVARAIFQVARTAHPKDRELHTAELASLAHSDEPADRDRARLEIANLIGIEVTDSDVIVPESLSREGYALIGIMLDAYHRNGLDHEALKVTSALVAQLPDSTTIARNHARALESVGQTEEALEGYRQALWSSDVDDTTAEWLGNELHNRSRYVDALEAYILACMLDPDDAKNFGHVAEEIARALRAQEKAGLVQPDRKLPDFFSLDIAFHALVAACSCTRITNEAISRCTIAAEVAELDVNIIALMTAVRESPPGSSSDSLSRMKFAERAEFARALYAELASPLTMRPGGAAYEVIKPRAGGSSTDSTD
ncbi:MAG: hypothetical protein ACLGI2_07515 [Acidimicrobiia bacterium]